MRTLIFVIAAYIAAQILADITSLKIIAIWGFSMDAGTLIYPLTFTLRDLVHKKIGAHGTRILIFTAAGINLFMAGLFWLVAILPGDTSVGEQAEFAKVLAPVWRIVLASIIAEVISELLDTEMYQLWVERITRKHQWARVLVSNAVSVPVDSAIFCSIAFWGTFPPAVVLAIFWSNVIVKGIVTVLSIPGIYLVKEDNW
ncbi:queuosine precursor transporter [candidate division KSB1 bacterium]|nr:queuosine precursor transporter [candidate division KSB1 bacterium]